MIITKKRGRDGALLFIVLLELCHNIPGIEGADFVTASSSVCPKPGTIDDISSGDTAWLLISSGMVFLMTPGVAFFYGGLVKKKNIINTLMMSYVTMGVIIVHWVLVGYSLTFGSGGSVFGNLKFGGLRHVGIEPNALYAPTIPHLAFCNFQMMFAIITPALISGSVVERIHFRSYILFIIAWTTLVYDTLTHWMWGAYESVNPEGVCQVKYGWLRSLGAVDFAGGLVIHVASGFSALMASFIVGKRKGYNPRNNTTPGNVPFVLLGSAMMWFGWLGFNGGSALSSDSFASLAVTNTSIAAAAGFITWMALDVITTSKPSAVGSATGAVIGMVGITSGSGLIYPGFSIIYGLVCVLVCYACTKLKKFSKIDDSLDVFFCHGVSGVVGSLLTGLFSTSQVNPNATDGAFYGNPHLFGIQILAVVTTISISCFGTGLILLLLKLTPIGLRIDQKAEEDGMDLIIHKEEAFDDYATILKLKNLITKTWATSNLSEIMNDQEFMDIYNMKIEKFTNDDNTEELELRFRIPIPKPEPSPSDPEAAVT